MIRFWFLLLVMIRLSQQNQTGVSQCGPQNLTVSRSDQTVLVQWEDAPSCSALNGPILYNVTVLVESREVHSDGVWVAPGLVGSAHSWSWTSPVPMDCAAHTVRLGAQPDRPGQELTLPDMEADRIVFPQDAVLQAGSLASFCCRVPDGQQFDRMDLDGNTGNTTRISERSYALTVRLKPVMEFHGGQDVHCITKSGIVSASTVYIGYPPGDKDLQCETRDLESVECGWSEGRNTMVKLKSRTSYQLDGSPCDIGSEFRCSKRVNIGGGERNWTLTAQNVLGKVEIQDSADLSRRVHMLAPHDLSVLNVGSRHVNLSWFWTVPRYHSLNLSCQMMVSDPDRSVSLQIQHGVGLQEAVLADLRPNWDYEVKVRCGSAQRFWTWGDWSGGIFFHTEGDVPDAPDVWMQKKKEGNQTVVVWKKLLANQSHGDVTGYEVTWTGTGGSDRLSMAEVGASIHEYALDNVDAIVVTVTAKNQHGRSLPSTITVPAASPGETSMNLSCFTGSDGGLNLSWSHHPEASCGYIVDWFPASQGDPVDWLKLPPSQNSVRIKPKDAAAGRRYSVSIYACRSGAPLLLLERKDSFFTEKLPEKQTKLFQNLSYTQQGSDVEIHWDPVPLTQQPACIHGYVLHYSRDNDRPISVTTGNPADSSLTARNLQSGSYTFTVVARTAGGEYGDTTLQVLLNDPDGLRSIFISLGAVFILLFLIAVLCCRHWACIKETFYPEIPKPNMADWFYQVKSVNPYHQPGCHGEDNMAVPELLLKPAEPLNNNNAEQEDMAVTSQAPPPYQKNPDQNRHGVSTVFPNLTYGLTVADPGRLVDPGRPAGPEPSGYHPQILAEVFGQNRAAQKPVVCVSEYIMAPQPSQ